MERYSLGIRYPIQAALSNGLLPVIHGDVVFDEIRGGTILSTEDLFAHLALNSTRSASCWPDWKPGYGLISRPHEHLLAEITPGTFPQHASGLGAATGADVTGGMHSKVTEMLALVEQIPDLEILIFSGEQPGNLTRALRGENPGTRLHR